MANEEDVVLTSAATITAVVASRKRSKDVDLVGCVSLGHSINFKVLTSVHSNSKKVEIARTGL